MSTNAVCWVDIPVRDLERARKFYAAVLDKPVTLESHEGFEFALLPHAQEGVSGSLSVTEGNEPATKGPLIYLNVEGRLDLAIAAVVGSGGKILEPKHAIGPWGFASVILDTEGNRLALHSPTP